MSAYRLMWLFVIFDLPTETKRDKREYAAFRQKLLKCGFVMHQYSVYVRHCASTESAETHIKRVRGIIPPKGKVSIVMITDKQFGNIINFYGVQEKPMPQAGAQLTMF